ncbi:MAG: hypothetical protein K9L56_02670 [Clostridiales bacterium]|nr:hypothetical protein [Clostridiales bacterium]
MDMAAIVHLKADIKNHFRVQDMVTSRTKENQDRDIARDMGPDMDPGMDPGMDLAPDLLELKNLIKKITNNKIKSY